MIRKLTKRENAIRKHFGLPPGTEVFFSRKGRPGPDGQNLHGWFCNEAGVTRYLGTSAEASVATKMEKKVVMPGPKFV